MEKVTEHMTRISRYSEEIDRLHRQVLTAVNVEEGSSTLLSTNISDASAS